MASLSSATVDFCPKTIRRYTYPRAALRHGIAHLGLGAFARGHLADFTDDALEAEFGQWGITGISLVSPAMAQKLLPQDGLYTLKTTGAGNEALRVIGCVRDVIAARDDVSRAIQAVASAGTKIVTLTVTEKGYCHNPASGALNPDHPDIAHDLAHPALPRSAIGLIAAGLAARHESGGGPLTVMSCDNLPSNGKLLKSLVVDFAGRRDGTLAGWIARECAFPCSMVDRIVPATTPADIAAISAALGVDDAAPVIAEPFRQWVIEDRFAAGRPAWEMAGAELVSDVAPFEFMKLRLLNGAHSALAYLGYPAGHETIAAVTADPVFRRYLGGLWREIIPAVPPPPGVDLSAYVTTLLERFQNPAIRHRTWQIAMDGSQKLPQRLLGALAERLAAGAPADHLILAVAGWMRYLTGRDEAGGAIDVRDPFAADLRKIADAAGHDADALARGCLAFKPVFGEALAANASLSGRLAAALGGMMREGARRAMAAIPAA